MERNLTLLNSKKICHESSFRLSYLNILNEDTGEEFNIYNGKNGSTLMFKRNMDYEILEKDYFSKKETKKLISKLVKECDHIKYKKTADYISSMVIKEYNKKTIFELISDSLKFINNFKTYRETLISYLRDENTIKNKYRDKLVDGYELFIVNEVKNKNITLPVTAYYIKSGDNREIKKYIKYKNTVLLDEKQKLSLINFNSSDVDLPIASPFLKSKYFKNISPFHKSILEVSVVDGSYFLIGTEEGNKIMEYYVQQCRTQYDLVKLFEPLSHLVYSLSLSFSVNNLYTIITTIFGENLIGDLKRILDIFKDYDGEEIAISCLYNEFIFKNKNIYLKDKDESSFEIIVECDEELELVKKINFKGKEIREEFNKFIY